MCCIPDVGYTGTMGRRFRSVTLNALQGSCGQAQNSAAVVDVPMSFEQCTVSMGSVSQPIMAAAFAPVWMSNIIIHSQSATQTAAISVSDGMLYMENSAVLAGKDAKIQSISLRASKAFITGAFTL